MVAIVRRQPTQADVAKMEQIRRENGDIILTLEEDDEIEIILENGMTYTKHKCEPNANYVKGKKLSDEEFNKTINEINDYDNYCNKIFESINSELGGDSNTIEQQTQRF